MLCAICVFAQSPTPDPTKQLWASISASFELGERTRVAATAEKHDGEEGGRVQRMVGAIFSYRMKRFGKHLTGEVDQENQYNLVLGAGYEFVQTGQNGGIKNEHRLVLESTPKYVIGLGILAQDRNRAEFLWIAGTYDFRYRNRLTVERPLRLKKLRLSPFVAGELFWDRNSHSWNQNQYAFGIQWPIRKVFKFNTYYLRQNCTTCSTDPLDVLGLTANFYFDWPRKR